MKSYRKKSMKNKTKKNSKMCPMCQSTNVMCKNKKCKCMDCNYMAVKKEFKC